MKDEHTEDARQATVLDGDLYNLNLVVIAAAGLHYDPSELPAAALMDSARSQPHQ